VSRIGKKPIPVPSGVDVKQERDMVTVKGPLGTLARPLLGVTMTRDGENLVIEPDPHHPKAAAMHGLMRTLVSNMVEGVSKGFSKTLVITGTGYKAEGGGRQLTLYLGYSKPIEYPVPGDVEVAVEDKNLKIVLKSISKESLGDTAAKIRALRPVEPYKGKGVAYQGEKIRRKVGKAGAK
jgi:large subunit ribosomal protein L6